MDYFIKRIKSSNSIYAALLECADCLYDQSYNDADYLKGLSKKYSQNAFFYVVAIDKVIAGFIAFYGNNTSNKIAYISSVVVKHAFQSLGIGSILLEIALSVSKLHGMTKMLLEVNSKNEKALLFYTKKCFSYYDNGGKETIYLMKEI